jgi:hypothetical protein
MSNQIDKNSRAEKSPITFTPANAEKLAIELINGICAQGFNALSKNDFYDFVLNLLDTHSTEHFFSCQSNQDNAFRLKASPAKIKASRLNIYLKFTQPAEQKNTLTGFIRQIADGTILVKDDGGKEDSPFLRLTVEDPVIRFRLDGEMKERLKISPDVRLNSEILVIEKADFYQLLRAIIRDDPNMHLIEREAILHKLDKEKTQEAVKDFIIFLLDAAAEAGKDIPFLPAQTIKEGLKTLINKFERKR